MFSAFEQTKAATFPEIVIGGMTEHDLLEVVEIEENSGLSRWGWSAYYAELQGPNKSLMLVARVLRPLEQEYSFALAGYIAARVSTGELHINNVAVRTHYRRNGIANALLSRILQEGQQLGAERAFLEVRSGNAAAQALYRKCGFELIGMRRNYYSAPPEDALIMSADLTRKASQGA